MQKFKNKKNLHKIYTINTVFTSGSEKFLIALKKVLFKNFNNDENVVVENDVAEIVVNAPVLGVVAPMAVELTPVVVIPKGEISVRGFDPAVA